MRSILELLVTRLEGAEEDREIQKTCECSPETGMPMCDTCVEIAILRDTIAEIARLRAIVEPLEALLDVTQGLPVSIEKTGVSYYVTVTAMGDNGGPYKADALPEALVAAAAERSA